MEIKEQGIGEGQGALRCKALSVIRKKQTTNNK